MAPSSDSANRGTVKAEPQLIDLSSALEEDASSAATDATAAAPEPATDTAAATPPSATAADTAPADTAEASAESPSTSESAATAPAPSAEATGTPATPAQTPEEEDISEETAASPEDQEWLFEAPASSASPNEKDARPAPTSFAGTLLDSRNIPLAASWNARSFAGTVLDSRFKREVEGKKVEKWQLEKTSLDSRAVREVKGRILSQQDQRFAGTILDARANRTNTQSPLAAQNLVRRFNAQSLLNPTPPTTGRFFVLLGPVPDFAFHECSGLSFSIETAPYAEGGAGYNQHFPTRLEYERLVFTRGLVIGPGWIQLRRWRESMLGEGPPLRLNGVIVMQNDLGVPICFWRFKNGFPVKWTGPTLRPGSTDLAVEVLEIAHEGLKVIDIALAGDQVSSSAVGMGAVMSSASGSSDMNSGMSIAQGAMSGDGSALGALIGS